MCNEVPVKIFPVKLISPSNSCSWPLLDIFTFTQANLRGWSKPLQRTGSNFHTNGQTVVKLMAVPFDIFTQTNLMGWSKPLQRRGSHFHTNGLSQFQLL